MGDKLTKTQVEKEALELLAEIEGKTSKKVGVMDFLKRVVGRG